LLALYFTICTLKVFTIQEPQIYEDPLLLLEWGEPGGRLCISFLSHGPFQVENNESLIFKKYKTYCIHYFLSFNDNTDYLYSESCHTVANFIMEKNEVKIHRCPSLKLSHIN
ncbi:hypothetical protein L9F63_000127, partial [Diploptera punctata]